MCTTCGCGEPVKMHEHDDGHEHKHVKIPVETDILFKNNLLAERNRGYFLAKDIFTVNLMSSPGSGKTTLLERTIMDLKERFNIAVIEGDQQTENDAERIRKTGVKAVQINTGSACHLDAHAVGHAVKDLQPEDLSIIFIENVGNLVCPASFDLGESKKVVILSITEGDDKPLKYPVMFQNSDLMVINKTDLLPYVDFNMDKSIEYAKKVNPGIEIVKLSAKTGDGLHEWYGWLEREKYACKNRQSK